jgi:hypothetical protein
MKFQSIFLFAILLLLVSCRKKEEESIGPESQSQTQVEDNNDLKSEGDQTNSDVNDAIGNFSTLSGGRLAVVNARKIICGCSIDSTQLGSKVLILNFDGTTPCGSPSRTRGGSIRVELIEGNRWSQAGARLKISHQNYKVTRMRDGKSWTFNGDKYLRNVNGTNWIGFLSGTDSLLFRERSSNMSLTFNTGATATHNIARATSWKVIKKPGITDFIQFSAMGDTALNGQAATDSWGTNRFGKTFTNHYNRRLLSNTYCQTWRPVDGEIVHKSDGNVLTVNLGVNEQGNPDTRDCAYGWKIKWLLSGGQSGEKIFSY